MTTTLLLVFVTAGGCSGRRVPVTNDAAAAVDTASVPARRSCAALRAALGQGKRLTAMHPHQALVADDLSKVVLLGEEGGVAMVKAISLPDGGERTIAFERPLVAPGSMDWVLDQRAVVVRLGVSSPLYLVPLEASVLGGAGPRLLSERACHHRVARGGDSLIVVDQCEGQLGTLVVFDLRRPEREPWTWSPASPHTVSPKWVTLARDGRQLAFVEGRRDDDCWQGQGTPFAATLLDDGRVAVGVLSHRGVLANSLMYARPGRLLLRFIKQSCAAEQEHELVAMELSVEGDLVSMRSEEPLGMGRHFGHIGASGERPYRVTPDGAHLLATSQIADSGVATLYAVSTDGSGERALAHDVLLQIPVISAMTPFPMLTADGGHVVFQQASPRPFAAQVPVAAVPLAGGKRIVLGQHSSLHSVAVAPEGRQVALVEQPERVGDEQPEPRLLLADASGATPPRSVVARRWIQRPRFLPRGAGLLYLRHREQDRATELHVCQGDPLGCRKLGGWTKSQLRGDAVAAPEACFVVFDSDEGDDGGGAQLVPLD